MSLFNRVKQSPLAPKKIEPKGYEKKLLHKHVHVIFNSHLDDAGLPKELEGNLHHILDTEISRPEIYQMKGKKIEWSSIGLNDKEIKAKLDTFEKEEDPETGEPTDRVTAEQSDGSVIKKLYPSDITCKARVAEIEKKGKKPARQRLLLQGKDTLDWFNQVGFADTPRGSKWIILAVFLLIGLHEKAMISMIQNDAGVVMGQLVTREMYFIWGLVLGLLIMIWALFGALSSKQLTIECFESNSENCRKGIHAGIILNSKQHSVDEQAITWSHWNEEPNLDALALQSIAMNEDFRSQIRNLEEEKKHLEGESYRKALNEISSTYDHHPSAAAMQAMSPDERYVILGACGIILALLMGIYMLTSGGSG